MYFIYSSHKTREAAEWALEEYFANGEICESEQPYIESRKAHNGATKYCVMFPGI